LRVLEMTGRVVGYIDVEWRSGSRPLLGQELRDVAYRSGKRLRLRCAEEMAVILEQSSASGAVDRNEIGPTR
jgi:hypothetical protein